MAVLVMLSLAGPGRAASDRIALVIGNDSYKALPALRNARNDASGIAAALEALGWEVILKLDASQRDMGRAIEVFEGRLTTAQAGLVFYAGHGVQARGENWLIPADASVESEVDLKYEGVSARDILEAMKRSGAPLNIVILDACRDNPLRQATRSTARGLAVPALPQGIKGTAVMFSAAPGETAQDGPQGGNGVFTGALLESLKTPGLKLEDLFKQTARRVAEVTANRQRPWFNSSVFGDFYFNDAAAGAGGEAARPPAGGAAGSDQAEIVFWQSIQNSTQPELYESYLQQFPDGAFAPLARAKLGLLRAGRAAEVVRNTPAPAPAPADDARPPASAGGRPAADVKSASAPPPAQTRPSDSERSRVEDLLANERDDLRRKLSGFMISERRELSAAFAVQNIWKAQLLDASAGDYTVEIHYEATTDTFRREFEVRTLRFRMRLAGDALEFVEILPERG